MAKIPWFGCRMTAIERLHFHRFFAGFLLDYLIDHWL